MKPDNSNNKSDLHAISTETSAECSHHRHPMKPDNSNNKSDLHAISTETSA